MGAQTAHQLVDELGGGVLIHGGRGPVGGVVALPIRALELGIGDLRRCKQRPATHARDEGQPFPAPVRHVRGAAGEAPYLPVGRPDAWRIGIGEIDQGDEPPGGSRVRVFVASSYKYGTRVGATASKRALSDPRS